MTRAAAGDNIPEGSGGASWQANRRAGAAAGAGERAVGAMNPAGAAGVAGNDADGQPEHFPDALPPAPLVSLDQDPAAAYEDEERLLGRGQGHSSDNALEARMAAEGTAQGGSGGKVSFVMGAHIAGGRSYGACRA
eukprot:GHRQ01029146.1.p2 GENE.GHRQ01029146.1~~GHRQ01029146.1.p2  ORF type:complete len:136 (-),score=46.62 GHRQ01029146.1:215-622(-)